MSNRPLSRPVLPCGFRHLPSNGAVVGASRTRPERITERVVN
jgi:hypothetical protein